MRAHREKQREQVTSPSRDHILQPFERRQVTSPSIDNRLRALRETTGYEHFQRQQVKRPSRDNRLRALRARRCIAAGLRGGDCLDAKFLLHDKQGAFIVEGASFVDLLSWVQASQQNVPWSTTCAPRIVWTPFDTEELALPDHAR